VLDDMAEEAYQTEHWRMNLRVAGEGMGDMEEVLEVWVRLALAEGSQKASFLRIVLARLERSEDGAGHLSSADDQLLERARGRGPGGRLPSW